MGTRILIGKESGSRQGIACMFCSYTGWAFGPIFKGDAPYGAEEQAGEFADWHEEKYGDPKLVAQEELEMRKSEFLGGGAWEEYKRAEKENDEVFKAMHSQQAESGGGV